MGSGACTATRSSVQDMLDRARTLGDMGGQPRHDDVIEQRADSPGPPPRPVHDLTPVNPLSASMHSGEAQQPPQDCPSVLALVPQQRRAKWCEVASQ